ncbi:MAG: L,D-transpeptidase ErfK/SrfK [Acidobacteriota bacterium]|jgi:lipoprotein-anchoring transpeptidase ErfK/SrfK|nr:L,D-transpeptidase ErfK/SrfK [Acidobacteriota bacterium]
MTTTQRALAATAAAFSFFLSLSFAGCQTAPVTNAPTATVNANTANVNAAGATNTNTTNANTANAGAASQPVTLAVLDALFADESFARDLKSKLQLTDEQVAQLRQAAGEERASLNESDAGKHGGTTQEATARATAKIKSLIGEDKATQLIALASERWSSGGEGGAAGTQMSATADQPNAVPTDSRIVVNAPAFRMDVFDSGRLVKSYKVGIGYPEFPLPAGMRKASQIIFNPTWTPPDEPWVESGKSKVKVGETVEAGSKLNPLGPIKIPIGLPSLIHGGKQPSRLGEFASHGCVGLTDALVREVALDIARLGGTDLTDEQIKDYAKNPTETKSVKLAQPVPVELRYETIVVTDDGKLHIYRDVYDRGTNTEENLRRVLDTYGVSFDGLDEQQRAEITDALGQMAHDALGRPAEGDGTARPNTNSSKSASNANATSSKSAANANANKSSTEGGHVTRNVKGQKEITIEIAALKGKGYPAPIGGGFDTGVKSKQTATAPKKGKRR